jgi:hypothetical protein
LTDQRDEGSLSERTWEAIVQNAQKGELYRIKFRGDPVTYEGIPLARPGWTSEKPGRFEFDVVRPERHRGVSERAIGEIETFERSRR